MSDIRKSIGWADWSSNEIWGCLNKCPYCYARNIAKRFGKQICGRDDFQPVWVEKNFQKPIPKYATHIFVNSMSDIDCWKYEWCDKIKSKALANPDKKFLILTKNLMSYNATGVENIIMGFSVTKQIEVENLLPLSRHFLSIEPIHERLNLIAMSMEPIQIIVGAETGNRKGKVIPKAEWIEEIREFCQKNGIKLFEKDSLKDIVKRPLIQERI